MKHSPYHKKVFMKKKTLSQTKDSKTINTYMGTTGFHILVDAQSFHAQTLSFTLGCISSGNLLIVSFISNVCLSKQTESNIPRTSSRSFFFL